MDVKNVLIRIDEDFIKNGAAGVDEDDVQKVMDKAEDIKQKVINSDRLKKFVKDVKLLFSMIKDYWNGCYPRIPWWVIAAIVFALLYILNPVDLIPDIFPVIGLVDDAAVLALCLALTEKDIKKYQQWKDSKEQTAEV